MLKSDIKISICVIEYSFGTIWFNLQEDLIRFKSIVSEMCRKKSKIIFS